MWVFLLFGSCFSMGATTAEDGPLAAKPHHATVMSLVVNYLEGQHYLGQPLDDTMSEKWLEKYLESLDYGHVVFLQTDVDDFRARYGTTLDDRAKGDGEAMAPAYEIYNLYLDRVNARLDQALAALEMPINIEDDETWNPNRHELAWPADEAEANEIWRKRIEEQVVRGELRDRPREEQLEMLRDRYTRRKKELTSVKSDDVMESYLGALAMVFDPHSLWFSPATQDNFRIEMEKSLEGIGARLRIIGEYTVVEGLIPGGPAELADAPKLARGDRVIAVGQGKKGAYEDVVDRRIDDVVALIRGDRDTLVRLLVIPVDATDDSETREIMIRRDKVVLEENRAELTYHTFTDTGKRVARIEVPSFYQEIRRNGQAEEIQSTTADVVKLIAEMDAVDGLVIDLRVNGGGSLDEALRLTGLFIPRGPVVQIRNQNGSVEVLSDPYDGVLYDGPLVVLTSQQSASASEIFAGAIQDYDRGLIVGSAQTHGKGSVQSVIDLDQDFRMAKFLNPNTRGGALKLTTQMFYRVNGASTQRRGVAADVVIPSPWDGYDFFEGDLDHALPWGEAEPARYRQWSKTPEVNVTMLASKSAARVAENPTFKWWAEDIQKRKAEEEVAVSLSIVERQAEQDARQAKLEERGQDPEDALPVDDTMIGQLEEEGEEDAIPDPMLDEALHVIQDYLQALDVSVQTPI